METDCGRVDAYPELAARAETLGQNCQLSLGQCSDEEARPRSDPGCAQQKFAALQQKSEQWYLS